MREETRALLALAWPVAFSMGSRFLINVTDVAVLGHLGTNELAAATLALVWINVTLLPVSRGFSAAVGALCAQAVGAGNFRLAGTWLRCAFFLAGFLCIPLAGLWLLTGPALAVARASPSIQALAQVFAMVSLVWLVPETLTLSLTAFLRSQEVVRPQAFINAAFVLVNLLFNVLLVRGLGAVQGLGFLGSPMATAITRCLLLLTLSAYAFILRPRTSQRLLHASPAVELADSASPTAGMQHETGDSADVDIQWKQVVPSDPAQQDSEAPREPTTGTGSGNGDRGQLGLSPEEKARLAVESTTSFLSRSPAIRMSHARTMTKLVLMNAAGIALEEWQLQVIVLMAGWLGEAEVAAFTAVLELYFVLSAFMYGITNALIVRMGAHIGAGNIRAARVAMRAAFIVAVSFGIFSGAVMILARAHLGRIFSDDPHVLHLTEQSWPLLGACYATMSLFYIGMAVLQAQARPGVVAIAFLIGAWLICIPLAALFAFTLRLGLRGLWYALILGYLTVTLIALRGVFRSDWPAVVALARERAGAGPTLVSEEGDTDCLAVDRSATQAMA